MAADMGCYLRLHCRNPAVGHRRLVSLSSSLRNLRPCCLRRRVLFELQPEQSLGQHRRLHPSPSGPFAVRARTTYGADVLFVTAPSETRKSSVDSSEVESVVQSRGHDGLEVDGTPVLQPQPDRWGWGSLHPRVRGLILLNMLVFLMATNWVVVKDAGEIVDPFTFAFFRFGVAAVALLPFARTALKDEKLVKAGLELGAWSAAGYMTQSLGLLFTDASRASFLSTFTVIVVPILAGFNGKGVKPFVWVSAFTAMAGVGLLEQSGCAPGPGDVWSFLSAVFFGIQVYRTEIVSRKLPHKSTLPLMAVVMTAIAVAAGTLAVAHDPAATWQVVTQPAQEVQAILKSIPWAAVLYTGLLSTDLALICEFEALHDVSSIDAALVYTLEPVLGAGIAWLTLGERWGPSGWVGAVLIIASSFATQLLGATQEEEPLLGRDET